MVFCRARHCYLAILLKNNSYCCHNASLEFHKKIATFISIKRLYKTNNLYFKVDLIPGNIYQLIQTKTINTFTGLKDSTKIFEIIRNRTYI